MHHTRPSGAGPDVRRLARFRQSEDGATTSEFVIVMSFVATLAIAVITLVQDGSVNTASTTAEGMRAASAINRAPVAD